MLVPRSHFQSVEPFICPFFFPSTKNNLNYQKYPEKDRSKIGKYVSENGSIAGVRKFIQGLTSSLQCNILRFGPKHEKDTRKAKKNQA